MTENNNTISLIGEDGKTKKYNVILTFSAFENDNFYIVYTDNILDEDGFLRTYAGIYSNDNGKESLLPIEKDEEWELIEKLLAKVDKESD